MSCRRLCVHIVSLCILIASNVNCASVRSPYSRRSERRNRPSYAYGTLSTKSRTSSKSEKSSDHSSGPRRRTADATRSTGRHRSYSYAEADRKGSKVVPKGTVIRIVMETNLSSKTSKRNDAFRARTAEAVVVGGSTLLPIGTRLWGRVESVTRFFRRSKMKLRFSAALLQDGRSVQMNANEYDPKKKGGMDKLAKKGGAALGKMVVEKGLEAATDGALMPFFALKKMKKAHDTVTKEVSEAFRKGQRIAIRLNEPMYIPR